jgi:hypothetical protein
MPLRLNQQIDQVFPWLNILIACAYKALGSATPNVVTAGHSPDLTAGHIQPLAASS